MYCGSRMEVEDEQNKKAEPLQRVGRKKKKKKKKKVETGAGEQEGAVDLTEPRPGDKGPGPGTGQTTVAKDNRRPKRKQRPEVVLINPGKSQSSGEILRALRSWLHP